MKKSTMTVMGLTLLSLTACTMDTDHPNPKNDYVLKSPVTQAAAHLVSKSGSKVTGSVRFFKDGEFVKVRAEIAGLEPGSTHGFHIHEFGDCSADDATSAGGHFNPANVTHGGPEAESSHVGDMGNITANDQGVALYEHTFEEMNLLEGNHPILGRAVVVHQKQDDLKSQPSGDAGPRIACGVIGVAKP